jgi:hypothetical protein
LGSHWTSVAGIPARSGAALDDLRCTLALRLYANKEFFKGNISSASALYKMLFMNNEKNKIIVFDDLDALLEALKKAKPSNAKGVYLKKITLSSTMGPGVTVEQSSLSL